MSQGPYREAAKVDPLQRTSLYGEIDHRNDNLLYMKIKDVMVCFDLNTIERNGWLCAGKMVRLTFEEV